MAKDRITKHILDDGYTVEHEDGSKTDVYKNAFSDGYSAYGKDGSKVGFNTTKNILDDGYTTRYTDGRKDVTYGHILDDGRTTYHSDGSKTDSYTRKNLFGDSYTTTSYTTGGNPYAGSSFSDSLSYEPIDYEAAARMRERDEREYWHPQTVGEDKRLRNRSKAQQEKLLHQDWLERASRRHTIDFWYDYLFNSIFMYGYLIVLFFLLMFFPGQVLNCLPILFGLWLIQGTAHEYRTISWLAAFFCTLPVWSCGGTGNLLILGLLSAAVMMRMGLSSISEEEGIRKAETIRREYRGKDRISLPIVLTVNLALKFLSGYFPVFQWGALIPYLVLIGAVVSLIYRILSEKKKPTEAGRISNYQAYGSYWIKKRAVLLGAGFAALFAGAMAANRSFLVPIFGAVLLFAVCAVLVKRMDRYVEVNQTVSAPFCLALFCTVFHSIGDRIPMYFMPLYQLAFRVPALHLHLLGKVPAWMMELADRFGAFTEQLIRNLFLLPTHLTESFMHRTITFMYHVPFGIQITGAFLMVFLLVFLGSLVGHQFSVWKDSPKNLAKKR